VALYNIQGRANIGAEIEPDGELMLDGAAHFSDESSFYGEGVGFEVDFSFVIEAASEDEARDEAEGLLAELRFSSGDNYDWEVTDPEIVGIERETPLPTPEEALVKVRSFIADFEGLDEETKDAFDVLLDSFGDLLAVTKAQRERIARFAAAEGLGLAEEFVEVALERVPLVVMLMRLAFYESDRRSHILENCGLARIHCFRKRLPMMHRAGWEGRKANSGMAFAWYVWIRGHQGPTVIDRISWEQP